MPVDHVLVASVRNRIEAGLVSPRALELLRAIADDSAPLVPLEGLEWGHEILWDCDEAGTLTDLELPLQFQPELQELIELDLVEPDFLVKEETDDDIHYWVVPKLAWGLPARAEGLL